MPHYIYLSLLAHNPIFDKLKKSCDFPMPYFIYKIEEPMRLTYLGTEDKYKEARAQIRQLRQEGPITTGSEYRMMFAKSQTEAERLLSTPRDNRVIGED